MATDCDLLRAHLAGDPDAFTAVVGRHLALVRAACARALGASAALDDAVQATFLVLARKAQALSDRDAPLAPWLHTVAHHVARNQLRIEARHARRREPAPPTELPAPAAHDPWTEIRPHLDAALEALPASYRQTLVLHYLDGLDRAAVGAALGLSVEAVKKRIGRGLTLLRGRLARHGVRVRSDEVSASLAVLAVGGAPPDGLAGAIARAIRTQPAPAADSLATGAMSHMTVIATLSSAAQIAALATPVVAAAAIACTFAAERSARAAADEGAPPPPSIAPAHALEPGTCFYYASYLHWTFALDDNAATNFLKDSITVTPVTEVDVWCAQVSEDAQHKRSIRLAPELTWVAAGSHPLDGLPAQPSTVRGDLPGKRTFVGNAIPNAAFCRPGSGDVQTSISDGAPTALAEFDPAVTAFGPALTRLGINDLLWPVPPRLVEHQPAALRDLHVTWSAGSAAAPTLHYDGHLHRDWPSLFTQGFQVGSATISATFSITADGDTDATVEEDAARGLPSHAISRLKAHVLIKPDVQGMTLVLSGTFSIEREAWLLAGVAQADAAPEALLRAMVPMSPAIRAWSQASDPTEGLVGRGVMDSFDHPPRILDPSKPASPSGPGHEF